MTYGYYLAASRTHHGDPLTARLARLIWRRYGHRPPGRFDGVSIWGSTVRLVARDLFTKVSKRYVPAPPFEIGLYHAIDLSTP